jgi:hypothetical protein
MTRVSLTREDLYPVSLFQGKCQAKDKPIVFRLDGWKAVPPTEEALRRDLLLSPFHMAIYANRRFHQFKGDTIIEIEDCPPSPTGIGNHPVLVGYGKDKDGNKFWRFGVLGGVIKILLRSGEAVRIRMAHASSSGQAI